MVARVASSASVVLRHCAVGDLADIVLVFLVRVLAFGAPCRDCFQAAINTAFLGSLVHLEWIVAVCAFALLVHTAGLLRQTDRVSRDIVLVLALVTASIFGVLGAVLILLHAHSLE